jgi:hypothetical protein
MNVASENIFMPADHRQSPPPDAEPTPPASLLDEYLVKYGELMTPQELIQIFRYPSGQAFRRAIAKGTLPIPVIAVPGRRGRFARTRAVVAWLEGLKNS